MSKGLPELRDDIKRERRFLVTQSDESKFSRNHIAFSLRMISSRFGVDEANTAIRDFKLEPLGWKQQVGEEPAFIPPPIEQDPLDRVLNEP
jgi:hypothetical protein